MWRDFSARRARDSKLPIASHSAVAASRRRLTTRPPHRPTSVRAIPATARRLDRNRQPKVWRNVRAQTDRAARLLSVPRNRAAPARAIQTVFVSLWEAKADSSHNDYSVNISVPLCPNLLASVVSPTVIRSQRHGANSELRSLLGRGLTELRVRNSK